MQYRKQLLSLKGQIDSCLKSLNDEDKNVKMRTKFEKINESIKSKMSDSEYAKFLKDGKTLITELKNNKNIVQEVADGGENALKPYKNFHRILMGLNVMFNAVVSGFHTGVFVKRFGGNNIIKEYPEILSLMISAGMVHLSWIYEVANNSMNPNTPFGEFIDWCAKSLKRIVDSFKSGSLSELIMGTLNYFIVGMFKNIVMVFKVATSNMVMGIGMIGMLVSFLTFLFREYAKRQGR